MTIAMKVATSGFLFVLLVCVFGFATSSNKTAQKVAHTLIVAGWFITAAAIFVIVWGGA